MLRTAHTLGDGQQLQGAQRSWGQENLLLDLLVKQGAYFVKVY